VLNGRAIELRADAREQRLALVALPAGSSDLDELVRGERDVDLV
jgi:hypothetical protein